VFDQFGTNDIQARWFEAGNSVIVPQNGGWLVVDPADRIDPELVSLLEGLNLVETEPAVFYEVERLNLTVFEWTQHDLAGVVQFLGYDLVWTEDEIRLSTAWEVLAETERPLKIFVHALDDRGQIASQWDGLDVDPMSWQAGDKFVQIHRFLAPAGNWRLATGFYDSETLMRLGEASELPVE
jgi:hypothetical protein